jgi:hypothetical protein
VGELTRMLWVPVVIPERRQEVGRICTCLVHVVKRETQKVNTIRYKEHVCWREGICSNDD